MNETVWLKCKGLNNCWHSPRLEAWKDYVRRFKPINDELVKKGQLEAWKLEKAEKRIIKSLKGC